MGSTAIDGLISGLKTTDLINSLMTIEAGPQNLLKAKVSTTDSLVSALQALNTKISSLSTSAQAATKPASWQAVTAASTAASVTATTSTGAVPSSLTFTVDAVAKAQTSISAPVTDLAGFFGGTVPSSVTFVTGTGAGASVASLDLTGVTDLAGFAQAINGADAGVAATVVTISATESRLQLTGKTTGATAGFDLYSGTVTASDLASATPPTALVARASALTVAADAQITLWPGTTAAQAVTSSTNTFSGIVTGVNFTVSAVTAADAAPVTVSVARDDAALKALASGLVANITTVLGEITSRTSSTTTTSADGRSLVTGGVLSGDSGVRMLQSSVLSAASAPVNGVSPSTLGIVLSKDGTITYDDALFSAALAAKVQAVVSGIAARLVDVANTQSDPTTGQITLQIQGQQSYSKSLGEQVDNYDIRLALRRAALEKTYSALEVSLSNLNAQSSWLTSQLSTLSTSSK
jgi:flagellar hook-associated protein 2